MAILVTKKDNPKICEDCCYKSGYFSQVLTCAHPQNILNNGELIDVVTGRPVMRYPTAEDARRSDDACSLAGNWFQKIGYQYQENVTVSSKKIRDILNNL